MYGQKQNFGWLVMCLVILLALWPCGFAGADDKPDAGDIKQELELVEETEEKEDEELSWLNQKFEPIVGEKFRLSGTVELNYEYLDVEDVGDENSGSSDDFFMSTAELAFRVFFNDWSKAKVVVAAEDIGKNGDDSDVRLDEAITTIKSTQVPLYLVAGKTVMPFGVFEDHLIDGTLAEDLYEIDEWGVTVGFNPDFYGLDL